MSNEKDNGNQLQSIETGDDLRSHAGNGDDAYAQACEPKQLAGIGDGDRDSKGRFRKGWKGGPGCGKSAASRRRLRERITQGLVDEALDTAAAVMRDPKSRAADRLRAAELLVVW